MKRHITLILFLLLGHIKIMTQTTQYTEPQIFNSQQGLSSSKVQSIVQDKNNFIWIGTEDGLNKFDGYHFTIYKRSENDTTSLINNNITSLYYDSDNHLWVGSMTGLQYYNDLADNFVSVSLGLPQEIMRDNPVIWITEDSQKNIWFSIHNQGVLKYSLTKKKAVLYRAIIDGGKLSSKSIRHITEDNDRNIWFSSFDNGITVYNIERDSFVYFNTSNSNLPTNSILKINQLPDGNMIIATLGKGVYIFDRKTQKFNPTNVKVSAFAMEQISDQSILIGTEGEGLFYAKTSDSRIHRHQAIPSHMYEITNSKIHSLLEDRNGNLWIAMFNSGICFLKKQPEGITYYKKDYDDPNSLSYSQITGITTDKSNNIWFATDGGGLNSYNKQSSIYKHYKHNPNDKSSLPDDAVVSVFCDSRGTVWAGTYIGGLCKYNPISDNFTSYQHSKIKNSLPGNFVKCIIEDKKNNLWIGTDGSGISYFDTKTEIFKNYSSLNYSGLPFDNVTSLFLQNDNILWIGSHVGICKFDIDNQKFINYDQHPMMNNLTVYSIAEDNNKNIWIGTSSGLYKYDAENDQFLVYKLTNYLKNIVVNGIVPYKDELWLSTNEGIICYMPQKQPIKSFIDNDELGGISFIRSSYHLGLDNQIYFGGGNGCYAFSPEKLKFYDYYPKVYITDIAIFNEPIQVGKTYNGRIILEESLNYTERIKLKHSENSFTIQFAAPNSLYAASIFYLCLLEGVDKQWITPPPNQQSITYSNLPPGKYTFHIYASNAPSLDIKNTTTLTIEILPPLWLTWWAKLGYYIFTIALFILIIWIIYTRMKDKSELQMERHKAKKQEELNQNKMQFFTNISHEFRTPLTLIISPLEEMLKTETNKGRTHLIKIMLRNTNRLLRLINQILDLRKAENNKIEIKAHEINLVLFVEDFLGMFTNLIQTKHISLSFDYTSKDIIVWYDPDLLEKCLYNLLYNAYKYTPDEGKIHIRIHPNNDSIIISISDNGCGIKEDELAYVFDRFYQGEYSKSSGMGTGIGLHLVKTIVELHKGTISVEGKIDSGSCFSIHIKEGNQHLPASCCKNTPWMPTETETISIPNEKGNDNKQAETVTIADESKPLILLVEDDIDMRMYIKHELSEHYTIEEVSTGREGLIKLETLQPALIITDVMMPEMNGIQFTEIVKRNVETCHIPVIMLTSNSEIEHQLEGLETGADSYIIKPFHTQYLLIRIRKLLETRKKIHEKFRNFLNLEAQEMNVTNTDEILLQNSISFIRSNISETNLSVEQVAKHLNISRTNLHRKIKTLTGSSPVELIRTIRMKQAAYLLEKESLTISEVAYKVGYNSLSYFSSSFNSYWGVSPSIYIKNYQSLSK